MKLKLTDKSQAWTFHRRVHMRMTSTGALVPLTKWERVWSRIRTTLLSWTRWWRPRHVCSAVNRKQGSISIATERWSWRRWRWE